MSGTGPVRPIRAAGGLLWRPAAGDDRLVCLVHRPRYDDWSLPKGKLHPGEHPLLAAVREIQEETGEVALPQAPLPRARYRVDGAPKVVDYWVMRVRSPADGCPPVDLAGAGPDGIEVDAAEWLPPAAAAERATHDIDRSLLRHWAAAPPVTGVVLLVRHADAGSRTDWAAADERRPLSPPGVRDAAALCGLLRVCGPTRLVSASPWRCRQTLAPLAEACGLAVEVDRRFDEVAADPSAAAGRLARLAAGPGTTVVCSQGAVIPAVLAELAVGGAPTTGTGAHHRLADAADAGRRVDWSTAKGDGWLLPFSGPHPLAYGPLRIADGGVPG